ncbi:hypothetical protein [Sneathiella glossodoripedis]|uniref:hypothetical protein n=1 Tax=Sneathiella glossodoripedis TaxID=418853 RepID=UPI0004710210|nr:hypothetical protein [Sneathiella glossodoripedis]
MHRFLTPFLSLFKESVIVYWGLLKIIVPVMIIVEACIRAGLIEVLSDWTAPFMSLFGLPAEAALLLATDLLVGLYPTAVVLLALTPEVSFTTADMTVIGGMILFAHILPVEQVIVKRAGVSLIFSCATRLIAMVIYGFLAHWIISGLDLFNEPANILIAIEASETDGSWTEWIISSAKSLFYIFWILTALIAMLRLLEFLGITKWILKALSPALRLIGIGPNAAPLTMVGILLGLSFGGGLIIREVDKGVLNPRSVCIAMIFLGFCHSLIEDTLLVIAFGAHWSGVLVGRVLLSILLILPLAFYIKRMPEGHFRLIYSRKTGPANE